MSELQGQREVQKQRADCGTAEDRAASIFLTAFLQLRGSLGHGGKVGEAGSGVPRAAWPTLLFSPGAS